MNDTQFPVTLSRTGASTLLWANIHEVEQSALDQIRNVSNLPWVHGVRVMPDVHYGKGATVGSVIAMRDAVSPSAVGVDIGCGMAAVKTSLKLEDLPENLAPIRKAIEELVPVGFRSYDNTSPLVAGGPGSDRHLQRRFNVMAETFDMLRAPGIEDRYSRALSQCGTLGGGNHFIELCSDEDGGIWITLHSGSRNIGKELAERHIGKAKLLEHNQFLTGEAKDLAVFVAGSPEMADYLHDLYWAQDYALLNRHVMLETVMDVIREAFFVAKPTFDPAIQCHHNYVSEERYDDTDLIITRKGAIAAYEGSLGIIPGSMGTGSYIVRGLGNVASYRSASHGAGRKMSRGQAKRVFTTTDLAEQTFGVECRKDEGVVDEIPGAYKDINAVMEAQRDLVEPVHRLTTLLCVKG